MKTIRQETKDSLKNEHEQIGHMQLRKTDIDVIRGAQQSDQFDGLKPKVLGIKSGWYKKFAAILVASIVVLGGFLLFGRRDDC